MTNEIDPGAPLAGATGVDQNAAEQQPDPSTKSDVNAPPPDAATHENSTDGMGPGGAVPADNYCIDDAAEIFRLALLPLLDYEREREPAAERLRCRVPVLDRLVEAKRASAAPKGGVSNGNGAGHALATPEIDPWPEPVNGAALLDDLAATIRQYVVLEPTAADAVALWIVHSHAIEMAYVSPRLAITSPEKRCGKTTLLTLLGRLVAKPLATANMTPAVLFRAIDAVQPTLLIDEADTFIGGADTMRGIINAGHCRATATVLRAAPDSGDGWEPRAFNVWGALALAAIGKLPGTIEDRSVKIVLRRKRPEETVERLRLDRIDQLAPLARQAMRWAEDHQVKLSAADPDVPAELHDRAADNWRPLLAIADVAGGGWSEQCERHPQCRTRQASASNGQIVEHADPFPEATECMVACRAPNNAELPFRREGSCIRSCRGSSLARQGRNETKRGL